MSQISRNQPCPCGSGKRYKHCCGAGAAATAAVAAQSAPVPAAVRPAARPDLPALMQRALGCQKQGRLADAEGLYREALALAPGNFDALHMLGVVRLQLDDPEDGARLILRAIRVATAEYPPVYANLALCLCAIARRRGFLDELLDTATASPDAPRLHFAADVPAFAGDAPLVSVLICGDGDAAGAAADLASLRRQTHRPLEEVAAPSLNDAARQANGRYVAPLPRGDAWDADRLELMARLLAGSDSRWGFSGVRFADAAGRPLCFGEDAQADALMRGLDMLHAARSLTAAFLQFNHALAAGNLLVDRLFWQELGGLRADCADPVWDFCVRASLAAPPAILYEPRYTHRVDSGSGAAAAGGADAARPGAMRAQWREEIARAFADRPLALQRMLAARYVHEWRLLDGGRVHDVEPRRLLAMAADLLGEPRPGPGHTNAGDLHR